MNPTHWMGYWERQAARLERDLATERARAEKAEQERDDWLAEIRMPPMTTVDEDGRVWRLIPATRTNIDEWPWQDPEDPIVLFRRLPLEDGE